MEGGSYDIGLLPKQYVQCHILLHITNQMSISQSHGILGFTFISPQGNKNSYSLECTQPHNMDIWSNLFLSIFHAHEPTTRNSQVFSSQCYFCNVSFSIKEIIFYT